MKCKLMSVVLAVSLLTACDDQEQTIPTYEVYQQPFELEVPVNGELESASATAVGASSRRPMTIAWLEKEYTNVKKGQLIARFDAEQLTLDMRKEMLAMMLLDEDMKLNRTTLTQEELDVEMDKALVVKEFAFADEFTVDDLRVYSRIEIIENMQNKEYLGAKDSYLDWKKESVVEQNTSSIDVLNIRKKGSEQKYNQIKADIDTLEVFAPYDGLLVYESNWRGEKPSVGETVFPGRPIAKIPDLSQMQAKGFVLDKQAIGLAPGQPVKVRLEAYPNKPFTGSLKQVSGFSRTISRSDPTKYFEVTIELDNQESPLLTPGRKLQATIEVAKGEKALLVPIQAIYNLQGISYVFRQDGNKFSRQKIEIGRKNLHFIEVIDGLTPGDTIALSYRELI